MKGNTGITSFELSLLRKYVTDSLSSSEEQAFDFFLQRNPEFKDLLDELTLADLDKIEQISYNSLKRVQKGLNGSKWVKLGGATAVITVLIVGSVWFQYHQRNNFNDTAQQEENVANTQQDMVAIDTSIVTPETYHKEVVMDTFYYVNRDEETPELAIEYIEEKPEEKIEIGQKNKKEKDKSDIAEQNTFTKEDSLPQSVTMIDNSKINVDKEDDFDFTVSLDYRQSIAVESGYASAYKVGQTKSFAGPIGGYEFDPEGMPSYKGGNKDFYLHLETLLEADTLLKKIEKKMEAKVSFEVDHKGRVENVNVVKCNHKQLCLKLTEIFENFPDWQPADYKGKKGSVHYVIQVVYE